MLTEAFAPPAEPDASDVAISYTVCAMSASRIGLVLSLLVLVGCSTPSSQQNFPKVADHWREIPTPPNREVIGEWDIPSDEPSNYFKHSTVSIIRGNNLYLLRHESVIHTGCCYGLGVVLTRDKDKVFSEDYFQRTYEIQSNGTLLIRSRDRPDQILPPSSPESSLLSKWP